MGKLLIIVGILFIIAGLIVIYGPRIPFSGRLPGDIVIERGNFKVYFPIVTCIVISILLSLILYFASRFKN